MPLRTQKTMQVLTKKIKKALIWREQVKAIDKWEIENVGPIWTHGLINQAIIYLQVNFHLITFWTM